MKIRTKIFLALSMLLFLLSAVIVFIKANFDSILLLNLTLSFAITFLIVSGVSQFVTKDNVRFFLYAAIFIILFAYYIVTKFVISVYVLIAMAIFVSIVEAAIYRKQQKK